MEDSKGDASRGRDAFFCEYVEVVVVVDVVVDDDKPNVSDDVNARGSCACCRSGVEENEVVVVVDGLLELQDVSKKEDNIDALGSTYSCDDEEGEE